MKVFASFFKKKRLSFFFVKKNQKTFMYISLDEDRT
jgi:hypothetical protein